MPGRGKNRRQRVAITFGCDGRAWNEELVLQRYELLYEAGLISRGGTRQPAWHLTPRAARPAPCLAPGQPMILDHRRILATGIARLRAKIKYHPVVFELMPENLYPPAAASAVSKLWRDGWCTSRISAVLSNSRTSWRKPGKPLRIPEGRPAKLFRFRREVLNQRAISGTKLPISRA